MKRRGKRERPQRGVEAKMDFDAGPRAHGFGLVAAFYSLRPAMVLLSCLGAAIVATVALGAPRAAGATTLTVTTTSDLPGADCSATCSLRQAVNAANTIGGTTSITFAVNGTFLLTMGELVVDGTRHQTLTVSGNGPTSTTIDGGSKSRLIDIGVGASVDVDGITLRGGNAGPGDGGAILNAGVLTVSGSNVSGNVAGTRGGGIRNAPSSTLAITNSTITNNRAGVIGGGIASGGDSTLSVQDSTISANSADGAGGGGGIGNQGQARIENSAITGNTASDHGGGIAIGAALNSQPGLVTLSHSLVSSNTVTGSGSGKDGGGIANYSLLVIETSVVTGNGAGYDGGGIANEFGATASITDSSIEANTSRHDGGGITNEFKGLPTNAVTLTRSSVTLNAAGHRGGGIFNAYGTIALAMTAVTANSPDDCQPVGTVPACTN